MEIPSVLAFVVCDTVITDAISSKKTLVGLFNTIKAAHFPHLISQFFVFVSITNASGELPVSVRLTSATGERIFNLDGKLRCQNPLSAPEIIFHIQNLPFRAAGLYTLELFAGQNFLASRTFTAELINVSGHTS